MEQQPNYDHLDTKGMRKIMSITIIGLMAIALFFASCKKDPQPQKPISVQVKTEGLLIREMKSFDVNTWTYNYNPNAYELKFTSNHNTYKFSKTIQELNAGFNITVLPDTYSITYESEHNPFQGLSRELDIKIDQTKTITSTELQLTAKPQDFLIVLDNNCTLPSAKMVNNVDWQFHQSTDHNNNYYYDYYNLEGDVLIRYTDSKGLGILKTIPNATNGNIYHIVSSVDGTGQITIEPFTYNLIGW